MIPDRIIEAGTLRSHGNRAEVEVRLPWYRALPASCIAGVTLSIDGTAAPEQSLRWEMNGVQRAIPDLAEHIDDWWFPTDSALVSGDLAVGPGTHRVEIGLRLFIPYIITDHGVLLIEEHASSEMASND